jgi:hypothetical protein
MNSGSDEMTEGLIKNRGELEDIKKGNPALSARGANLSSLSVIMRRVQFAVKITKGASLS